MAIKGGVAGIAGPICAGKSTLGRFIESERGLEILSRYFPDTKFRYVYEATDEFARDAFYNDREKNSDEFELTQAGLRRQRHIWLSSFDGIAVLDRTLVEGFEVFATNSYEDEYLSHAAYDRYVQLIRDTCDRLGRHQLRSSKWLESTLFYMKVEDPEILCRRQAARGDPTEKIIPKGYHEAIIRKYGRLVADLKSQGQETYGKFRLPGPRVVELDGTSDININQKQLEEWTDLIGKEMSEMVNALKMLEGGLR